MKNRFVIPLAVLLTGTFLSSCGMPGTPQPLDLSAGISPRPVTAALAAEDAPVRVMDFALRLFRACAEDGTNTLISPLSVLTALSMTANGADGNTLVQMENVLGMNIDALNNYLYAYFKGLPTQSQNRLAPANSVWFKDTDTFTVNEDFLQINADYYGADLYSAPFDDATCNQINNWVKDKTDGMIRNIIDEIPEEAVMYLINALAFDAEWQTIYHEDQIRDGVFTTEDGTVLDAEMMYSEESLYLEDTVASGFIKYYKDRDYAFAALLPKEGVTVSEYIETLDAEKLYALLCAPQSCTVNAAMPKFGYESDIEMSELLESMGMTDAFGAAADFSKLGHCEDGYICINRVLHKTKITVDEKGTKAGAATAVEMVNETACVPMAIKDVCLDRPFVYLLFDCESHIPFFIGTVMHLET